MFYWLSRMHKEYKIQHIWCFFEAKHGKGEHDGADAFVKRARTREQLKFEDSIKFQATHAIMGWCNTNISTGSKENSII